jgi:hypothetical protein
MMHRIKNGPFRDAMAMDARDLADSTNMSVRQTRAALRELERKGFIVNFAPELSLDKAILRLTMVPFQGAPPTQDYVNYEPTPNERRRLEMLDRKEARHARRNRRAASR